MEESQAVVDPTKAERQTCGDTTEETSGVRLFAVDRNGIVDDGHERLSVNCGARSGQA